MSRKEVLIGFLLLTFMAVGGMVDTYISYRFFPPQVEPPWWLDKYISVWVLFIWVGVLPFLLVWVASDFDRRLVKIYLAFLVFGSVIWDLAFAKIWSGSFITPMEKWFHIGSWSLGFSTTGMVKLHLFRLALFLCLLIWVLREEKRSG